MRFKGIHYLNEPVIFDGIFAIMRPFMKEKILQRVSIFCVFTISPAISRIQDIGNTSLHWQQHCYWWCSQAT